MSERHLGESDPPQLIEDERGLALISDGRCLRADLTRMLPRLRQPNLSRELLVRAARIRGATSPLHAVDATAGLGEDALLLAASGFTVRMYERDSLIAALLADGLRRAAEVEALREIVGRMELVEGDSIEALSSGGMEVDVVYLDPMFPSKRKAAATKKKLQVIQKLEQPSEDDAALVEAALAAHPRKVVIKRPLKGPWLAGIKPSHSLSGKVVRYDCLVPPRRG